MSAPNIGSPTTINGKVALLACTGSLADLFGTVSTGHCLRVQAIYASNTTASPHPVTVNLVRSATNYAVAPTYNVPANSTINVLDGKVLYLEESDKLQADSDASSQIVIVAPYEDIS